MEVQFTKMHGLGNDFIFIKKSDIKAITNIEEFIIKYSNRHIGIGCDQFIIFEQNDNYTEMEIYNSDGSSAKACGNATRCLTHLNFIENKSKKLRIKVLDRMLDCEVEDDNNISVNMGKASFDASWIPSREKLSDKIAEYLSHNANYICVDVGNPHLVIIDNSLSDSDKYVLGELFEKSEIFQDGVNVNFVKLSGDNINLKVWERGVGFTYACGSGACASFAACNKLGYIFGNTLVNFQIGSLEMKLCDDDIIMKGSATLVAKGVIYE
jgi:diaminopimelate epimerase